MALTDIRIVLVEPAGPLNVGSIARIMKNMGLEQLVLVNPHCDPLGPEARQMAVHAGDLLEQARCVSTLPEALVDCQRAIATTARQRTLETVLEHPRSALPWLLATEVPQPCPTALIFGPEDRGLSNDELNYAQRFVKIPSNPAYPSLNLAQSVAVCCYELFQVCQGLPAGSDRPMISAAPESTESLASLDALEGYFQQLESVLLAIGYLYPHTATSRMEKFRRLFHRAQLSAPEVAMLRGILSQVTWAMQHPDPVVSPQVEEQGSETF